MPAFIVSPFSRVRTGGQARSAAAGWSLLELIVVVGLLAFLAGMAVPSLSAVLLQRQVQSTAEVLVGDLRWARAEAIKRSAVVTICSSGDGEACTSKAAWREGWIVFVDRNQDRKRDADEDLLRVQEEASAVLSIASTSPRNDKPAFSFHATGWAKAASQTLVLTPRSASVPARVVCISSQGRAALRPAGQTTCS